MKAELIELKVYTEEGIELYEKLKIGKEDVAVYVGIDYPRTIFEGHHGKTPLYTDEEKQIFSEVRSGVRMSYEEEFPYETINFSSKEDLYNKIDNKAYDPSIDKKFKDFILDYFD